MTTHNQAQNDFESAIENYKLEITRLNSELNYQKNRTEYHLTKEVELGSQLQKQIEDTQTKPTIDVLSYRLNWKHDDITSDHDFINTFDMMTRRAISLLEVMAGYMAKTSQSKDDFIDADAMYYTLQTAINEIKDVKAVTNAYVDSKNKA